MFVDSAMWASAADQLNRLCIKVGLDRTLQLPVPEIAIATPEGAALWSSSYARVLLWPCAGGDLGAVEQAAAQAQAWFDEILVQAERTSYGGLIDGYLVLALPEPPEDVAREEIRRLELSAQVCRKHLIWPSTPTEHNYEPSLWQRVADITVLGLPEASAPLSNELHWPNLDTEAQALWTQLTTLGVTGTILLDERPQNARD